MADGARSRLLDRWSLLGLLLRRTADRPQRRSFTTCRARGWIHICRWLNTRSEDWRLAPLCAQIDRGRVARRRRKSFALQQ